MHLTIFHYIKYYILLHSYRNTYFCAIRLKEKVFTILCVCMSGFPLHPPSSSPTYIHIYNAYYSMVTICMYANPRMQAYSHPPQAQQLPLVPLGLVPFIPPPPVLILPPLSGTPWADRPTCITITMVTELHIYIYTYMHVINVSRYNSLLRK